MPISVTNPGVYVPEIPSGGHTVTAVATGVTAFVGRARVGPVEQPLTVFNYADFTRAYGGLNFDYPMSYAVEDFFANGGSQAVIARLFERAPDNSDGVALLTLSSGVPVSETIPVASDTSFGAMKLAAANPGEWGNRLFVRVDTQGITDVTSKQFAAEYGLTTADLFNLTLELKDAGGSTVATEHYLNQTVRTNGEAAPFPNRLDRTLANSSTLARVVTLSLVPPDDGANATGAGGSDGTYLTTETYLGDKEQRTGIHLLEHADIVNLLCIPPDKRITDDTDEGLDPVVNRAAAQYCTDRRAFFIADPPATWASLCQSGQIASIDPKDVGITGQNTGDVEIARNAAVFFPRLIKNDVLMGSQQATFSASGSIAGLFAATDATRGVWKAPAGTDACLANVAKLELALTDSQNGRLNPLGINCLRQFLAYGPVVWGSRTLRGADLFADDFKYISVRRLTLFIEESISRSTQWTVFEKNDEALWSSLRLTVGSFLTDLARQGAFYDHVVKCDAWTTSDDDIAQGRVNILVLFAPKRPAEFIVLRIQQLAGKTS